MNTIRFSPQLALLTIIFLIWGGPLCGQNSTPPIPKSGVPIPESIDVGPATFYAGSEDDQEPQKETPNFDSPSSPEQGPPKQPDAKIPDIAGLWVNENSDTSEAFEVRRITNPIADFEWEVGSVEIKKLFRVKWDSETNQFRGIQPYTLGKIKGTAILLATPWKNLTTLLIEWKLDEEAIQSREAFRKELTAQGLSQESIEKQTSTRSKWNRKSGSGDKPIESSKAPLAGFFVFAKPPEAVKPPADRIEGHDLLLLETKEGLSAYSKPLGKWSRVVVGLPKDGRTRLSRATVGYMFAVVVIDNTLLGYSSEAARWGILVIPDEYVGKVSPIVGMNILSAKVGDRMYVLSPKTGKWTSPDDSDHEQDTATTHTNESDQSTHETTAASSKIVELMVQEQLLLQDLGPDHPRVKAIQKEIAVRKKFENESSPQSKNAEMDDAIPEEKLSRQIRALEQYKAERSQRNDPREAEKPFSKTRQDKATNDSPRTTWVITLTKLDPVFAVKTLRDLLGRAAPWSWIRVDALRRQIRVCCNPNELALIQVALKDLGEPTTVASEDPLPEEKLRSGIDTSETRRLTDEITIDDSKATKLAEQIRAQISHNRLLQDTRDKGPEQKKNDRLRNALSASETKLTFLREELNQTLETTFELKNQLEQLRIRELQSRLSRLEQQIGRRQSQRDQIIERRARELIEGDETKWSGTQANDEPTGPTDDVRPAWKKGRILMLRADADAKEEHMEIAKLVKDSAAASGASTAVSLFKLDPVQVTQTLRGLFSSETTNKPWIEADAGGRRILIRGTAEQLNQIKKMLIEMGETSGLSSDIDGNPLKSEDRSITITVQIRVSPRNPDQLYRITTQLSTDTFPPEQVTVIDGGVNILVEGKEKTSHLSADRAIIRTKEFKESQEFSSDLDYRVVLEGNVVIRQEQGGQQNVIRADRASFDARDQRIEIAPASNAKEATPAGTLTTPLASSGTVTHTQKGFPAERSQPVGPNPPSYKELANSFVDARHEVAAAKADSERQTALYKTKVISREEVERAKQRLDIAQSKYQILKDNYAALLKDTELQLKSAEAEVKNTQGELEILNEAVKKAAQTGVKTSVARYDILKAELRLEQSALAYERIKDRFELYKKTGSSLDETTVPTNKAAESP